MRLETDLASIQIIAEQREEENVRFRSFLKAYDGPDGRIDALVHDLYQKVSSEIDCRQCSNCCRTIQPELSDEDVRVFAAGLTLPVDEFRARYLVRREERGKWRFRRRPCPFLAGNLCTNYEQRPQDCRSYPHLHKEDFVARLWNVIANCSICPIVFTVYEQLKEELRYGDRLA